jgi:hypothetical protein
MNDVAGSAKMLRVGPTAKHINSKPCEHFSLDVSRIETREGFTLDMRGIEAGECFTFDMRGIEARKGFTLDFSRFKASESFTVNFRIASKQPTNILRAAFSGCHDFA